MPPEEPPPPYSTTAEHFTSVQLSAAPALPQQLAIPASNASDESEHPAGEVTISTRNSAGDESVGPAGVLAIPASDVTDESVGPSSDSSAIPAGNASNFESERPTGEITFFTRNSAADDSVGPSAEAAMTASNVASDSFESPSAKAAIPASDAADESVGPAGEVTISTRTSTVDKSIGPAGELAIPASDVTDESIGPSGEPAIPVTSESEGPSLAIPATPSSDHESDILTPPVPGALAFPGALPPFLAQRSVDQRSQRPVTGSEQPTVEPEPNTVPCTSESGINDHPVFPAGQDATASISSETTFTSMANTSDPFQRKLTKVQVSIKPLIAIKGLAAAYFEVKANLITDGISGDLCGNRSFTLDLVIPSLVQFPDDYALPSPWEDPRPRVHAVKAHVDGNHAPVEIEDRPLEAITPNRPTLTSVKVHLNYATYRWKKIRLAYLVIIGHNSLRKRTIAGGGSRAEIICHIPLPSVPIFVMEYIVNGQSLHGTLLYSI